jgi:hypothetical protein
MPESTTERQITGDAIISELLHNADVGAFKVRYTTLLPCIFNVYLHAEDHEQITPIADFIRSEAKQALNEHLEGLNGQGAAPALIRKLGLGAGKQTEYKILEPDWTIEFHPDHEERLRRGDIEVYSELGSGPRADLGAGSMTTFITRRPVEAAPPEPVATPAAAVEPAVAPVPASATAAAELTGSATSSRTERQVHAYIRYSDKAGEKTFPVTRDQIVIGRGGKSFWVDLKIEGPPDVSREHCRIRRDATTKQFFIKDVSQFGTTVDGQQIPSSLERSAGGEKVDRNVEAPLPPRAQIGLADVFFLQFEAAGSE